MTLVQKQMLFAKCIGKLLTWIYENPRWGVTFGDAFRNKEQAAFNALNGVGIRNSLHSIRLAIDLNLFIDGKYQTNSEAYKELGEFWKSLDPLCRWGGDFETRKDGNHFSIEHNGVR